MRLDTLQARIESRYGLETSLAVEDFLVTEPEALQLVDDDAAGIAHHPREVLLVAERDDTLDVSLYIDGELLERLGDRDPFTELDAGNLDDFLVAVEGVSHFVYLAHNARYDKSVTPFELELQAEIDKFLVVLALVSEQSGTEPLVPIHDALFDAVRFGDWIAPEARERYEAANFYAGKYCWQLIDAGIAATPPRHLERELCRFYRLPRNAKVRHIDRARMTRH